MMVLFVKKNNKLKNFKGKSPFNGLTFSKKIIIKQFERKLMERQIQQKENTPKILRSSKKKTSNGQKRSSKRKRFWTEAQDKILFLGVQKYGCRRWSEISKLLKNRHPKRCRERWFNYLCHQNRDWTQHDLWLLFLAFKIYGNKWSQISKILKRGDNVVKNKMICLRKSGMEQFQCRLNQLRSNQNLKSQLSLQEQMFVTSLIQEKSEENKIVRDKKDKGQIVFNCSIVNSQSQNRQKSPQTHEWYLNNTFVQPQYIIQSFFPVLMYFPMY